MTPAAPFLLSASAVVSAAPVCSVSELFSVLLLLDELPLPVVSAFDVARLTELPFALLVERLRVSASGRGNAGAPSRTASGGGTSTEPQVARSETPVPRPAKMV